MLGASLYPWLWTGRVEDAISELAANDFGLVEVLAAPPHVDLDALDPGALISAASARAGVSIVAVNLPTMDVNLAAADSAMRAASVARYLAAVDLAAELGAPRVVVCAGKRHPLVPAPIDLVRDWSRASLASVVKHASVRGTRVCLENLPYGFVEKVSELRTFAAEEFGDEVEVMFDLANAHMVEPVPDAVSRSGSPTYMHASDTTRARWCHAEVGQGDIDFVATAHMLNATAPPLSILELAVDDPLDALVRSRDRLRALGWPGACTEEGC